MISFCQIMYSFIRSGVFVWALSDFAPKYWELSLGFCDCIDGFCSSAFLNFRFLSSSDLFGFSFDESSYRYRFTLPSIQNPHVHV